VSLVAVAFLGMVWYFELDPAGVEDVVLDAVDNLEERMVELAGDARPNTDTARLYGEGGEAYVPAVSSEPVKLAEPPKPSDTHRSGSAAPTLDVLRGQMLDMINERRSSAGMGNVTLGNNTAPQAHAEEMKQNCYLSHWNMEGIKPDMRYAEAGGQQYNAENVSGHTRCYGSGYAVESAESQLREAMYGLMGSPGHRSNILDPHHVAVNLGIAWDEYTMWVVQHFEYGYVEFTNAPSLEGGMLSFTGNTRNGAAFHTSEDMGITIYYSPYPRNYTSSELNRTTCYDAGRPVALIREAAPPGYYYLENTTTMSGSLCLNPDAATVSGMIRPPTFPHIVGWYDADVWHASGESFELSVDIGPILDEFGAGVYTTFVWASGDAPITSYPILYEVQDAP
jgi:uncharacterized protein YkwD